ncbi:hypothetical protein VKT23_008010 [Stygiomarasmius scandens]|uniref:Uncharacterized protein n=1 Tax=Marasmiellus scandens TaxID=2682957 RepID=A0ABR1JPH4_9AGAR
MEGQWNEGPASQKSRAIKELEQTGGTGARNLFPGPSGVDAERPRKRVKPNEEKRGRKNPSPVQPRQQQENAATKSEDDLDVDGQLDIDSADLKAKIAVLQEVQKLVNLLRKCNVTDPVRVANSIALLQGTNRSSSSFSKITWNLLFQIDKEDYGLPESCPDSLEHFCSVVKEVTPQDNYSLPLEIVHKIILSGRRTEQALGDVVNGKEATKVAAFNGIFIPIISLFDGAIVTIPEAPISDSSTDENFLRLAGFADHRTLTLGDISIIYVELKQNIHKVAGLAQLLAELIVARKNNVSQNKYYNIHGILLDGTEYLFVCLEEGDKPQFRVTTHIQLEIGRWPTCAIQLLDIVNTIFGVVLESFTKALQLTYETSKNRPTDSSKLHSAQYLKFNAQPQAQRDANVIGQIESRDSTKFWFEAFTKLEKVQNALKGVHDNDEQERLDALQLLSTIVEDLSQEELLEPRTDTWAYKREDAIRDQLLETLKDGYETKRAIQEFQATRRVRSRAPDLYVLGHSDLINDRGKSIIDWCSKYGVGQKTIDWLKDSGYTETFLLESLQIFNPTTDESVPLGHWFELRRAAEICLGRKIPLEREVFAPVDCFFPDKDLEDWECSPQLLEWSKKENIYNVRGFKFLSWDHVHALKWKVAAVTELRALGRRELIKSVSS